MTLHCLILSLLTTLALLAPIRAAEMRAPALPADDLDRLGIEAEALPRMETLAVFPDRPTRLPELSLARVELGSVARDRWLWAIHFRKPHTFRNSSFILYLDADNDPATGRKGMGCEVMLTHSQGAPGVSGFAPDGGAADAPAPRVALVEGVLYLCYDGPLRQEGGRSAFRFSLLSETREPHASVDSTGWVKATGPAASERAPLRTLADITADEGFERTEGLDLVWKAQADAANVVFSPVTAELKGFAYYDTEYRWPAVAGGAGSITVTVPKAGRYHPAVVVYDTAGREAYEVRVDGRRLGRFVAAEDDRRQRIHFLSQPVEFKGGEKLTVVAAGAGSHITEDILLLARRPEVRARKFAVQHVEVGYVAASPHPQPLSRSGRGESAPVPVSLSRSGRGESRVRLPSPAPGEGPGGRARRAAGSGRGGSAASDLPSPAAGEGPGVRASLRLTWITTWPAACTVEVWSTPADRHKVTEPAPLANHRLLVPGLKRGVTYRYRIVAPRPDGTPVTSPEARFLCAPPAPVAGTAKRASTPLTVANPYDFPFAGWPVSSGVPFAQGELGDAAHLRILDAAGTEVPVQVKSTARWRDGSIKWVLATFPAVAKARSSARYTVQYGAGVIRKPVPAGVRCATEGDALTVETGRLRARFEAKRSGFPTRVWVDADGDSRFADAEEVAPGRLMAARVTDDAGKVFASDTPAEGVEVEEAGPLRAVVKVTGHHRDAEGKAFLAYINRFVFTAGSPLVRLCYTWGNDRDEEFTRFRAISLDIPFPTRDAAWRVGLGAGKERAGRGAASLRQMRDNAFTLESAGSAGDKGERADGWVDLSAGGLGLTAAVRDFWQLYPKALRVTDAGLSLDLCPPFEQGTYDACSKLEEIKHFFYVMGGRYKVRQGVQKQHEVLLAFRAPEWEKGRVGERENGGAGAGGTRRSSGTPDVSHSPTPPLSHSPAQLARAFQEAPIAVCTPERYCGTKVFGEVLPATAGRSAEYERVCEGVYQFYVANRERGHEYGMLNFGDQFGERKVNWANGEYDHHHAFLMQFIRTGDPKWYALGERAARHAIDVDTCHYGPRQGGEWIHSMGHTGGYFTQQYEGNGIPGGGFTPSHTWTEGFCDWFFLSGDPTAAENAGLVADHYNGAYLNNYDFSNCRDNGWNLILTLAAYRATGDPFHLNAARIIVERTLERQSPTGGWHRQMVPGHCLDMPRHRGEANFMLGVLANGLELFHNEVPDPRVAQAVIGGARQAVKEMWVPEVDGFRYTSCPNMAGYIANNDMVAEVLFFAARMGGDAEFGEIALRAMRAAFKGGIGSVAHLRWTPHILYNMDLLSRGRPFVTIEGARSPVPGERSLLLRARISDSENDVTRCEWNLDGKTVLGEQVTWTPAGPGVHRATVTVTDRKGNRDRATAAITTPPAELAAADPARVTLVEAEAFAAQGLDQVRVYERTGCRGKMISSWEATKGHWLEWEVPVATEGEYTIYLRYCSGGKDPRRSLAIDGRSPGKAFDDMALPPTGGFCTSADNWSFHAAGAGTPVHLTAGTHRLRLANLGDGVGLDYLVLLRAK